MIDVALAAPPVLDEFNRAGVLDLADVHVAKTLGRVCGESSPQVLLAAALAVRAPRQGHVCLELGSVAESVAPEEDATVPLDALTWPAVSAWLDGLQASPLVGEDAPLHLDGDRLYLNRSWRSEQLVIRALLDRVAGAEPDVDEAALTESLAGIENEERRVAVESVVRRRFAVIAGGPGTGKTTTIKTLLAVLRAQGIESSQVALAAPTGKAAQRVTESVGNDDYKATTLHRLLRRDPGNATRFRHNARNPLPHDVVIVDEGSMVSLDMMAKLLAAVRPEARLVLVGDPDQLVSIESGAVLGDVVGPVRSPDGGDGPMASAITLLRVGHRNKGAIADLARAIQSESVESVLSVLEAGDGNVTWLQVDVDAVDGPGEVLSPVRDAVVESGRRLVAAAHANDATAALAALDEVRLLCAHKRGPYGVEQWVAQVEQWLALAVDDFDPAQLWYVGRPVLVTQNDYQLGLLNGDTGVTIEDEEGRPQVAFRTADGVRCIAPARLENVQTVHAMTIHKSQGSQFSTVLAVLPDPTSKILTRELLYTAVTRAEDRLIVVGTHESVVAAVHRPVVRSSGLRDALWS